MKRIGKRLKRLRIQPTQSIAISFGLVVLAGTLLLSLPGATTSGERLRFVDALFTATSATCVTGLAVLDTGRDFSVFGQIVILVCIQLGGIGLMTFTTVFAVILGRRLAIVDRVAIQESFHHGRIRSVGTLIKYIVAVTLVVEALGAVMLSIHSFRQEGFSEVGKTLYRSVFHSVSAFCNAGFSLFPDSLAGFQSDPAVLIVIASLITAGGIGFLVGLDIKEYVQNSFGRRFGSVRQAGHVERVRKRPRLSVHSKFVLITHFVLLAIGLLSYYFLERRGVLGAMSPGDAWMNALFCSVTPRTAGFNTVDYTLMSGEALLCTMVLMFIGASPGSCGGGIKTSTFGMLVAYSISRWRGHPRLDVFNRTIPQESIDRAAGVVVAAIALLIVASSILMVTETKGLSPADSQVRLLPIVFETVSAFGTVGLSLNQTPHLTDYGKIIISVVMFMGRIGPVTLAIAISLRQRPMRYRYPEEGVMVG